jgi:hypothetical protein
VLRVAARWLRSLDAVDATGGDRITDGRHRRSIAATFRVAQGFVARGIRDDARPPGQRGARARASGDRR